MDIFKLKGQHIKKALRRKAKKSDFNPSHEQVSSAVKDYFDKGGNITELNIDGTSVSMYGNNFSDDFLMGK